MDDTRPDRQLPESVASIGMHLTLEVAFEDAVPYVQLEHEYVGFETVAVTRLDRMIRGALGEEVPRMALLVVCHAEVARGALAVDARLAGMLPCTTAIYEVPDDDRVHVHHVSVAKVVRHLGYAPPDAAEAVDRLVELSGDRMAAVWENIEAHADIVAPDEDG